MDHDRENALSQFFPGEEDVDLYNVIGVSREATQEEIRKAYRRQALVHHPDKQVGTSEEVRVNASVKFHQLGFAYAVLGDEKRRKRYDSTGSTEEALPLEENEDGWDAYFKDLFDKVTKTRLDEDKKAYQGSPEELQDLQAVYLATGGSFDGIMGRIPHSNYTDEERFTKLLNNSIKKKEIPSLESWKKELADKTGRARRKKEGENEAKDAEDAARELGVWDEFYNNGQGKGPTNGEEDYSALKALIQGRKRKADDFLEGLAAKYTKQTDGKRTGGGKNGRMRKKAREP